MNKWVWSRVIQTVEKPPSTEMWNYHIVGFGVLKEFVDNKKNQ